MRKTAKKIVIFSTALLLTTSLLHSAASATSKEELQGTVDAKIIETMNSGGYTYILAQGKDEKSDWVAIPESSVKKGDKISYYKGMVMKNFTSKTLNRTFETIVFSPGLAQASITTPHTTPFHKTEDSFANAVKAEKETSPVAKTSQRSSGGSLAAVVPFEKLKLKKIDGENGYTVDEIFRKAKELNGKKVSIRGKVVKFSPMIMGRNWVHLQDGTGNAMKNHHDLVITTQESVKEGDIVIAKGVAGASKDFGSGYSYEVIVEEAVLTTE